MLQDILSAYIYLQIVDFNIFNQNWGELTNFQGPARVVSCVAFF